SLPSWRIAEIVLPLQPMTSRHSSGSTQHNGGPLCQSAPTLTQCSSHHTIGGVLLKVLKCDATRTTTAASVTPVSSCPPIRMSPFFDAPTVENRSSAASAFAKFSEWLNCSTVATTRVRVDQEQWSR